MDEAEQWVLKAREVCSEITNGDRFTEESDNDDNSDEMIAQSSIKSPSERPALPLPSVQDLIAGVREEIHRMEGMDRTKAEKAASKCAKKAPIAEVQAQKIARRQAEKTDTQRSNEYQVARPEEQGFLANNREHPPKVEDQDQPPKQKKKGRKRKSELELPFQSEDYHKHKMGKMDGDAQDANFNKTKSKKDVGPQHSPFFQRSSGVKPKKKKRVRKAEKLTMDFQPPMIQ